MSPLRKGNVLTYNPEMVVIANTGYFSFSTNLYLQIAVASYLHSAYLRLCTWEYISPSLTETGSVPVATYPGLDNQGTCHVIWYEVFRRSKAPVRVESSNAAFLHQILQFIMFCILDFGLFRNLFTVFHSAVIFDIIRLNISSVCVDQKQLFDLLWWRVRRYTFEENKLFFFVLFSSIN